MDSKTSNLNLFTFITNSLVVAGNRLIEKTESLQHSCAQSIGTHRLHRIKDSVLHIDGFL